MQSGRETTIKALREFGAKPMFRCTEPEFHLLNPSPATVTSPWADALRACANSLVPLVESGSSARQIQTCISSSIQSIRKPMDTEDREYVAYYYHQLGNIAGANVAPIVNRWLYGRLLSLAIRLFGRA